MSASRCASVLACASSVCSLDLPPGRMGVGLFGALEHERGELYGAACDVAALGVTEREGCADVRPVELGGDERVTRSGLRLPAAP